MGIWSVMGILRLRHCGLPRFSVFPGSCRWSRISCCRSASPSCYSASISGRSFRVFPCSAGISIDSISANSPLIFLPSLFHLAPPIPRQASWIPIKRHPVCLVSPCCVVRGVFQRRLQPVLWEEPERREAVHLLQLVYRHSHIRLTVCCCNLS